MHKRDKTTLHRVASHYYIKTTCLYNRVIAEAENKRKRAIPQGRRLGEAGKSRTHPDLQRSLHRLLSGWVPANSRLKKKQA